MPLVAGCMSPKVSMLRKMLTICSSAGVEAIQSMYLSAVRGNSGQEVSVKRKAMSSLSLPLRSSIFSEGAEAAV